MSSVFESKIRFKLEPMSELCYDDEDNPFYRKNLRYFKMYSNLRIQIIFATLSLPILAYAAFSYQILGYLLSLPLLIIPFLILKLKIKFHRVAKRIKTEVVNISPGEVVAKNFQKQISLFVVLKKSIGLYYLKKVSLEELVSEPLNLKDIKLTNIKMNDLKILKPAELKENFLKVIPVSGFEIKTDLSKNDKAA